MERVPPDAIHPRKRGDRLQVHEDDHPAEAARLAAGHEYEVRVSEEIARHTRVPIEGMVAIGR
jgi:hypothetical protein